jgi:membrane associated rhomboid family serine protease
MGWQDRAYNQGEGRMSGFALPPLTPLTVGLMLTCLAVFIAQALTGPVAGASRLVRWGWLDFHGAEAFTQPWRWITYQYLHGSGTHLFFNMIGLYFFLPSLERLWGWKKALAFYTLGGIAAGVVYGIVCGIFGFQPPIIGASGSVLALIGACAYLFPEQQVIFFLFAVPIRVLAVLLAIIYLLTVLGDHQVSDACHLGGLAFGFLAPYALGPAWSRFTRGMQVRRMRRETVEEQDEEEAVDRILDKVHAHGMHSLSWRDRRILRRATQRQRQRDMEVARRRG